MEHLGLNPESLLLSDEIQTPCFLKCPREFYCCASGTNLVCCGFSSFLNLVSWITKRSESDGKRDKMQDYTNARIHVWALVSVLSLADPWLNCATVFKT